MFDQHLCFHLSEAVKRSLVVLGQVFWCALWTNTPPTWYTGLCPVYWVEGLVFDARHQKSDLARQSALEKGEVKVGKEGKGRKVARLVLSLLRLRVSS